MPLPVNTDPTEELHLFGTLLPNFQLFAATTNVSFPLVLALLVYIAFNAEGVHAHGPIGYVKSLIPAGVGGGMLLLIFPIEILSNILRLLSLTIRLWANLLAGHMLITFMSGGLAVLLGVKVLAWLLLPFGVGIYLFEAVLIAGLQAFIFAILAAIYLGTAVAEQHSKEHHLFAQLLTSIIHPLLAAASANDTLGVDAGKAISIGVGAGGGAAGAGAGIGALFGRVYDAVARQPGGAGRPHRPAVARLRADRGVLLLRARRRAHRLRPRLTHDDSDRLIKRLLADLARRRTDDLDAPRLRDLAVRPQQAVFPRIREMLDRRAAAIGEQIDAQERLRAEAEDVLREYREQLAHARAQADEIVVRAREAGKQHERETLEEARARRERMLEQTKRDIEDETRRALDQIRKEVATLTILATEKVTRKTLSATDQRKLVDDALGELDFTVLEGSEN